MFSFSMVGKRAGSTDQKTTTTHCYFRACTHFGYKLHLDTIDGGIPVSALVTSASLNDSQVAIPLATITGERIINCYDLMDAAYDVPTIIEHSQSLGHVPLAADQLIQLVT